MTVFLTNFVKDRSGATAIEYSLIASLVVLAIIAALYMYQANVGLMYHKIEAAITGTH